MDNNDNLNTPEPSAPSTTGNDDFLKSSNTVDPNIYGDFFQETSDGNISIGPKAQKSWLEIATMVLSYVVPIAVVVAILLSIHVFIRGQDKTGFAENYQFICPYLNYGVDWLAATENKWCKTISMIAQEYEEKQKGLQNDIIDILTEYIPVKTSNSIIDASPEKKFVLDTFKNKVHVDDIMKEFNKVVLQAWSKSVKNNIECSGINITNKDTLMTQCTIYGWAIGEDDLNNNFGSARIETLRFTEMLGNTPESHFILINPPTALSIEEVDSATTPNPQFQTRTTIPVQVRYAPVTTKS
jgi:hypothetical protein